MLNKRQHGMTLVELTIAIVIIGVGLAGVLGALSTVGVTSADPMIRKQMIAIAESMMEEVQLLPYTTNQQVTIGPVSCARDQFLGTWDFNNYNSPRPVCDISGLAIPALAAYRVAVTVAIEPGGSPVAAGVAANRASRITVTVTQGGESYQLQGWRIGL